jgi:hypothetical protein
MDLELIGSWKIIAIWFPLLLQFFSLKSPTLLESKLIVPSEIFEIVAGNNPIIAKEETDFPEPDSPQSLGFHCAANHN